MENIKVLILCSILSCLQVTLALPSWYPKNLDEIARKCNEENHLTSETEKLLSDLIDSPHIRSHVLCRAKAMNIYSEDDGFYINRMIFMYKESGVQNKDDLVQCLQQCVDKYKKYLYMEKKFLKQLNV